LTAGQGLKEQILEHHLEHHEISSGQQDQLRAGGKLLEQVQNVMEKTGTDAINGERNSLTASQDLKQQILEQHHLEHQETSCGQQVQLRAGGRLLEQVQDVMEKTGRMRAMES
jgi:alkaline phosphatase